MKYFKRNTRSEKEVWHKWFARFPVIVGHTPDGDAIKVWWEEVYRCGTYECGFGDCYWIYEYSLELVIPHSTKEDNV